MILHGDCLDVMAGLDAGSVDSVVTDPPYGLKFMGKQWDHGVPGVPFWEATLRVAKPGSFLLAFGGTRTWHRLACAIEDAGWKMRDTVCWLYGQGFPKGKRCLKPAFEPILLACKPLTLRDECAILAPIIEEAICALKGQMDTSLSGLARTVGLLNTVSSLRECLAVLSDPGNRFTTATAFALTTDLRILRSSLSGLMRVVITRDGTPNVGGESVVLDAAATSRSVLAKCERLACTTAGEFAIGMSVGGAQDQEVGDWSPGFLPIIMARKAGVGELQIGACRLATDPDDAVAMNRCNTPGSGRFKKDDWANGGWPAKAEVFDTQAGRWPANVCLDEEAAGMLDGEVGDLRAGVAVGGKGKASSVYGTVLDRSGGEDLGYAGSGGPSRFFYCAKASVAEREAGLGDLKAIHPTVKPLALMRWLCRLVTPPGGTVLDPFAGSGTTGCAAALEGCEFIGIEREPEYVRIAEARIAHWNAQPSLPMEAV